MKSLLLLMSAALLQLPAALAYPEPAQTIPLGPLAATPFPQPARALATPSLPVWISVDSDGGARTITPVISTVGSSSTTTISPAPSSLTATGTWTLSPNGVATTSTGTVPPVMSATGAVDSNMNSGTGDAGALLQCSRYQGLYEPFCSPAAGVVLGEGKTYYVTWSPTYFADPTTPLSLQVDYERSGMGFASLPLRARNGFYPWTIPSNFLSKFLNTTDVSNRRVNATLYLAYYVNQTNGQTLEVRIAGPQLFIVSGNADRGGGKNSKSNAVAIAIPVVVGIVALVFMTLCVCVRKRTGHWLWWAGAGKKGGKGYGEGKSQRERVGSDHETGAGFGSPGLKKERDVELTDRDSWSPSPSQLSPVKTGGSEAQRNVFREEVKRQDRWG